MPYCSSPLCSSALMLLCQLLKPDKLSIFSVASQKAANSPATKLLISRVSFASVRVILQFRNLADVFLLLLSVNLCFQPLYLKKPCCQGIRWLIYRCQGNPPSSLNGPGPPTSEHAAVTGPNPRHGCALIRIIITTVLRRIDREISFCIIFLPEYCAFYGRV